MEFLLDPDIGLALVLVGVVGVCVLTMYRMRDPASVAPHAVSASVWCGPHQQSAVVDFIEWTTTGLTLRRVQHCPLRAAGERCHEECCHCAAVLAEAPT